MKIIFLLSLLMIISACGKHKDSHSRVRTEVEKLTIGQCARMGQMVLRNERKEIIACADKCSEFKKKIPADWFKESIEVPEDPTNPEGQKIKVFYYGKISPGTVPTVFFNGGPGSDSHSSFKSLSKEQIKKDPSGKISFVYIDQRGNGCSDFYPQGNDEATLQRLTHYGSSGIVSDAEIIRKKLMGDKPWVAFGQSYGGFIAHRYYVQHPKSLLAAVSHGNTINSDGYQRIKNRIRSQLRLKEQYLAVYPQDKRVFDRLKNYLGTKDCIEDPEHIKDDVCGLDIVYDLMQWMGFRSDWEDVHTYVDDMWWGGEEDLNWGAFEAFVVDNMSYENPKNKQSVVGKVLEWVDRDIYAENLLNCQRIQKELLAEEGIDLSLDPLNECASTLQSGGTPKDTLAPYKHLPQDKLTMTDLLKTLKNNPEIPLYVYSGELDPFLPKENYVEEKDAVGSMPNFHYMNFMTTGHDGFKTEQKVWDDIKGLLPLTNLANLP